MENRLHGLRLSTIALLWLFMASFPAWMRAQNSAFNFSYSPIPHYLAVDSSCVATLNGQLNNPTVTSALGGTIVTSAFSPDSSGFTLNTLFTENISVIAWWFVADNLGNTAYFPIYVTFKDSIAPWFDTTGIPLQVTYPSIKAVPPPPNIPVADNCYLSQYINVAFSESPRPPLCQAGSFTRTWTATDPDMNATVFTQTVNILQDLTPPTITTFPSNGSALCTQLDTAYPAWLAAQMLAFKASDISGISSYSNNAPALPFPNGCTGQINVIFTATDSCGLASTAAATFTVADPYPPDIIQPPASQILHCPANGDYLPALSAWIAARAGLTVADSCTPSNLLVFTTQINGLNTDSLGIIAAFESSLNNDCTAQDIGTQVVDRARGIVGVDFLVTDACTNSTLPQRAYFVLRDTTPPTITPSGLTETCGGGNDQTALQNWIDQRGNASITDACAPTQWTGFTWITSSGQSGFGTFSTGPYPVIPTDSCSWHVDVTFRAADKCGNIGVAVARFTLEDNNPPVFSGLPPVVTLACPATLPTAPSVEPTDNCDTSVVVSIQSQTITDSLCAGHYNVQITWRAEDNCGNSAVFAQTFQVRDLISPVFSKTPANLTFRCDTFVLPPLPVFGTDLVASDNCSPSVSYQIQAISTQQPDSASCGYYNYTITRLFTATDDCGNSTTASQVITVVDNLPPVLTGIQDTTLPCTVAIPILTPESLDACGSPVTSPVVSAPVVVPGICPQNSDRIYTWTSTDVCGNTGQLIQTFHIIDTVAPALNGIPNSLTAGCNAIPPAATTITGTDNCAPTAQITFQESEIRNPDLGSCDHWANYIIVREWTATDACGNSRTRTQFVNVEDNLPPQISAPATRTLPNTPGLCGANVIISSPISAFEECSASDFNVILRDTVKLTGPPQPAPVDTVILTWVVPNTPPVSPAVGSATLTIIISKADTDANTERFAVFGETGGALGVTNLSPTQCNSTSTTVFTINASQLNPWLIDGQLTLKLIPQNPTNNPISNVCTGPGQGQVFAQLSYDFMEPNVPVVLTYSIDGSTEKAIPATLPDFLGIGSHIITYYAADCAGNSASATSWITVNDVEPPAIAQLSDTTIYTGPNACEATFTLPFPNISDNCSLSGELMLESQEIPLNFQFKNDIGFIPVDLPINLVGGIPNAVTNGILRIAFWGDFADNGEFFDIYDENNQWVGNTLPPGLASSECQLQEHHEIAISVTPAMINTWTANGTVGFTLKANDALGSFFDFINPCGPQQAGTDGISRVKVSLEYNFAVVPWEIRRLPGNDFETSGSSLNGNQTSVTLPVGQYAIQYRVADASGIESNMSFNLTIRDTIDPVAKCQPAAITVNPSGLPGTNYTLSPVIINNGSTDNCPGTLTYSVSPSVFTCNQAGGLPVPVMLTVTDVAGNSSTCSTVVSVSPTPFIPTYTPVCSGEPLLLNANPPFPDSNFYSYMWTGPNGTVSANVQNPIFSPSQPSYEGTWTVKITGITGCTATGSVTVDLSNLPIQPVINTNGNVLCEGENIVLSTNTYSGVNVRYLWYAGINNPGTLLQDSTLPSLSISQPPQGNYNFFVVVVASNCYSVESNFITVQVRARPVAQVNQAAISVCAGDPIAIGTPTLADTYSWTGPAGFNNSIPNPLVDTAATEMHEGQYILIITKDGCISSPAFVQVTVENTPATPEIFGYDKVCEGDAIQFAAIPGFGDTTPVISYIWKGPNALPDTIFGNSTYSIPNVSAVHEGNWIVKVVSYRGCVSLWSLPEPLSVDPVPEIMVTSNAPLCEEEALTANATSNLLTDPVSFNWLFPINGGQVINTPVLNLTAANVLPGVYQVIGRTPNGCADTTSFNVQITALPEVNSLQENVPACVVDGGTNYSILAAVEGDHPPFLFTWRKNGQDPPLVDNQPNFYSIFIGNTAAGINGIYSLVITDTFGCQSKPKTIAVQTSSVPATPVIQPWPKAELCEGAICSLNVAPTYTGNTIYRWTKPNGQVVVTSNPFLVISPVTQQDSGTFKLKIIQGECESPEVQQLIQVFPIPPKPTTTFTDTLLCEGSVLQLGTPIIPGATYQWTGKISSTSPTPVIPSITTAQAGGYQVQITLNGCTSPASNPVSVSVQELPKTPVALDNSTLDVCLGGPGDTLNLMINPSFHEPGNFYQWFNNSQDPIGSPTSSLTFSLTDLSGLVPGENAFYVKAIRGVCTTASSNLIVIQADTIPNITASAGADRQLCQDAILTLNAQVPSTGTGCWTVFGPGSPIIIDPCNANSAVHNLEVTDITPYLFVWSLSNGACKGYGFDSLNIEVYEPETAYSVSKIDTCNAEAVQLVAIQGSVFQGYWTQEPNQAMLSVNILEPDNPQTLVTGVLPGQTYRFFWVIDTPGCTPDSSMTEVRVYRINPSAPADFNICNTDSTVEVTATVLNNEILRWYSPDPDLFFTNPAFPTTTVRNLKRGPNIVILELDNGFCGKASRDTVIINYDLFPTAVPDTIFIPYGTQKDFNILLNDIFPPDFIEDVTLYPIHGQLFQLNPGQYRYRPDPGYSGPDEFIYKLCNTSDCGPNGASCTTAKVKLLVEPFDPDSCLIPTVITPNGDFINDSFIISCLVGNDDLDSEVYIYNQWGDEVFHAKPYLTPWDGTFNGEKLPAGTYYSIVRLDKDYKVHKSFLIIQY